MKIEDDYPLGCSHGFTLLELMVTVGTLAILTSLAIPTYKGYVKKTRKLECQISIVNYLRAQDLYFVENEAFYAPKFNKKGKSTSKIGWKEKKRPDKPAKYRFSPLGVGFRRENHRGYRIRVWNVPDPGSYRHEVWLEFTTNEDFDGDGGPDSHYYRKVMRPATKGKFRVIHDFWFDIGGCPPLKTCE